MFKKILCEHYQSFKSLDPDQDQPSVGPDLDPNWLQRLPADDKLSLARQDLMFLF